MQTPIILLVMEASTLIAQHCNTYVWWRQVIDLDPLTLRKCTSMGPWHLGPLHMYIWHMPPLTTIAIYNHLSLNKGPSIVYITNP